MKSPDLWIKALHIVAVISWMAGMLYLPRLFVYHADAERKSAISEQFKVMERRLLKGIVNPAMIVVWITGPLLAWREGYFLSPWLHAQTGAGAAVDGAARLFRGAVRAFAEDRDRHSSLFYRVINEVADGAHDPRRLPGGDEAVEAATRRWRPNQTVERFAEAD